MNKVVCPKCKFEIERLCSEATATIGCDMYSDGEIELANEDLNSIAETNYWRCPECDEVICLSEEEAIKFFKEEKC